MKNKIIFPILSTSLFFICSTLSGCGKAQLASDWRERQITIDGKYTDWPSTQSYYDERTKVIINLLNDEDYLYICLVTRNREVEINLMENGFTAWFDPDGGNAKKIGICFPAGLKNMGISLEEERNMEKDWQDQEDKSGLIDREKERWKDKEFNKSLEKYESLQDKLKITGELFNTKDKEKHRKPPSKGKDDEEPQVGFLKKKDEHGKDLSLEEAAKLGIEARLGRENDYFVYELKMPLVKSAEHPYAIEAKKGNQIGLGLETSMPGMRMMKEEIDTAPMETRPGMFSSERFQLWATVELASGKQYN